jgi:hypothetical protein
MSRFAKFTPVLIALLFGACESCSDCSADESRGGDPNEPTLLEHEGEGARRGDAGAPSQGEAASKEQVTGAAFRTHLEGALKKFGDAMEAGIAAERGDSECERALTGITGMAAHIAANAAEGARVPPPPNGIAFIQFCESLEVEVQRCLVLSYHKDNAEQCARVIEELPPEEQQRLHRVTGR